MPRDITLELILISHFTTVNIFSFHQMEARNSNNTDTVILIVTEYGKYGNSMHVGPNHNTVT